MRGVLRIAVPFLVVPFLVGCVSSSRFNQLKAEQALLQGEKSTLQEQTAQLAADNAKLKGEIESLQMEARQLAAQRDSARQTHSATVSQYDAVVSQLSKEVTKGNLQIRQYKNMLTVDVAEKIFFASGSAVVKPTGQEVLKKVGAAMADFPDKVIRVVGHTDNVPLRGRMTNWELSVMRATSVVRFLEDHCGIDPRRLVAAGRGEYQPVAANDSPDGRQKNRRIEITLMDKNLADTVGELAVSTPKKAAKQVTKQAMKK